MRNYKTAAWACALGSIPVWSVVVLGLDALPLSDAAKGMTFLPFASAWIFLCVFLFRKAGQEKREDAASRRGVEQPARDGEALCAHQEAAQEPPAPAAAPQKTGSAAFCSSCGNECGGDFCPACGAPVAGARPAAAPAPRPKELPYGFNVREMDKIYPSYGRGKRKYGAAYYIALKYPDIGKKQAKEIVDAYLAMFPEKAQPTFIEGFINHVNLMDRNKTKNRISANKAAGIACCPKCGSTSIQPDNGKFHLGRAIVGAALLQGGAVMGLTHGKKITMVCLYCGHKWMLKTK